MSNDNLFEKWVRGEVHCIRTELKQVLMKNQIDITKQTSILVHF